MIFDVKANCTVEDCRKELVSNGICVVAGLAPISKMNKLVLRSSNVSRKEEQAKRKV
jgi:hypothetical protein